MYSTAKTSNQMNMIALIQPSFRQSFDSHDLRIKLTPTPTRMNKAG
jgi:hypothetical protein